MDHLVVAVAGTVGHDARRRLGDAFDDHRVAQDRGLEGHLQIVLDHHGEAAQLRVVAIRVDRSLFDQRAQFFLAQFRHAPQPRAPRPRAPWQKTTESAPYRAVDFLEDRRVGVDRDGAGGVTHQEVGVWPPESAYLAATQPAEGDQVPARSPEWSCRPVRTG